MPETPESLQQRYWQAFTESLASFKHESILDKWPESVIKALPRVISCSDFVAEQLAQYPHYLSDLLQDDCIWLKQSQLYYVRQVAALDWGTVSLAEFEQAIRQFRNKAYIRIIWRDCLGLASIEETMRDISDLADVLIKQCLRYHHTLLSRLHGQPVDSEGNAQQMVIIGMGKLGAHELNLSSDIDLIFAYPEEGKTQQMHHQDAYKPLTNQMFFTRLGQRVIQSLDQRTQDGFVFRVDMRLRPYGQSGALVSSFASLENYYVEQGRTWERYAFIKARAITGDYHQVRHLFSFLHAFVYRKYIDYGVIHAIRDMKALINREVLSQGDIDNIKTGTGGIREIEFIAQVFQLIRGGQKNKLRVTSLLNALFVMQEEHMLPGEVIEQLQQSYIFLRRLEQVLQAVNDQQTHSIPKEDSSRMRIAYAMGFLDWKSLSKQLEVHRNLVRMHFAEVVKPSEDEPIEEDTQRELYKAWWLGELSDSQIYQLLEDTAFLDIKDANRLIVLFREIVFAKPIHRLGHDRLDTLMPIVLSLISKHQDANLVLERILLILECIIRRSAYMSLLIERPKALERLVMLCGISQWIAEQLSCFPHLMDELLYDFHMMKVPRLEELKEELRSSLMRVSQQDLEAQMEILRIFKNVHQFHAAIGEMLQVFHVTQASDYLTYVAECLLQAALDISSQQMIACYGLPQTHRQTDHVSDHALQILVIAYGKMGSLEMSYVSDLDLVFAYQAEADLYTQGPKSIENHVFYVRLVQRMIHILSTTTYGGRLYEVDTRLRPSGESGLLVCQLEYIREYLLDNAWIWEHQALVRARAVAGHPDLCNAFSQMREDVLCLPRPEKILQVQVVNMREKMLEQLALNSQQEWFDIKQDPGGLVDIEFMVQYGVLLWAQTYPQLTDQVDTLGVLLLFSQLGLLSEVDAEQLKAAYIEYRSTIHMRKIQNLPDKIAAEQFKNYRDVVRSIWKRFVCTNAA